ncbi:MAG TPA: hypothetical protein DCW90_19920 [Lachnospiraceae bacterium]|nr:trypsin-like peptidase domain-containing protein [uncultured Lachnoclostridium sp.]HAU87666.1 hypothetical protein [Lachnospiraceae bacterium]
MNNDDFNNENNIDNNAGNRQNETSGYGTPQNQSPSGNSYQNNTQDNGYNNNGYQNYNQYGSPNQGNGNFNYNSSPNGSNHNNNNKWKKIVAGISIAASVFVVGSVGFYGVSQVADQLNGVNKNNQVASSEKPGKSDDPNATSDPALDVTEEATGVSDSVSNVAENVMPSIVSITTTATETVSDFFGRTYSEDVQGSGSGIIIGQNSNEVLVATNNHVISGQGATVELTFKDGKSVKGTVKGADPSSDLAVVSVKFADISDDTKEQIKVISIGDSDKTKVGEVAIAIGNALGYGQSVTVGHISALDRQIAVEDSSMTLMQTDAAINPGNSGGALLNAKGQLIGINSAKTATTEVEGMGYAIPISDALPIIQDLMEGKSESNGNSAYLGIVGQDVNKSYSQRFNIPEGVYVTEVAEGSPAEKAGIKTGMVIVGLDGKEIKTTDNLMKVLNSLRVGDMVSINVAINNGGKYETKELTVTMGSKSEQDKDSGSKSKSNQNQNPNGNDNGNGNGNGNDYNYDDPFGFFGN